MIRKIEECSDKLELGNVPIENGYKLNLRKETQHFIIQYTKFDKKCIDKISEVLENSYNRITNSFNQQLYEKLIIAT